MGRQRVLALAGTGVPPILAGCSDSGGNGNTTSVSENSTSTPGGNKITTDTVIETESPTATDEVTEAEEPIPTEASSPPEESASSQADGLSITPHETYPVESGDNEGLGNVDGTLVSVIPRWITWR